MRHGIWRADCKCAVENAGQESDSIIPTSGIVLTEVAPHCRVGSMHLGHSCDDDDGHDSTHDDEEQSNLVQERQYPVAENDKGAARPGDEHESNVDVPWLDDQVGMKNGVHLHCHVGRNGDDRGEIEYPSEEVERAGEESEDAAVAGPRRYRGPVIYAAGRGDGRRKLLKCQQTFGHKR